MGKFMCLFLLFFIWLLVNWLKNPLEFAKNKSYKQWGDLFISFIAHTKHLMKLFNGMPLKQQKTEQ